MLIHASCVFSGLQNTMVLPALIQNIPAYANRLFYMLGSVSFNRNNEKAVLKASNDSKIKAVGAAFDKLKNGFSEAEETIFTGIETLRAFLLQNEALLSFQDYGVGGPEQKDEVNPRGIERQRTVADICRRSSKPEKWARLLFALVLETKPGICLELGACLGISAAYQVSALQLTSSGRLITVEGARPLAELSRENLSALKLNDIAEVINGPFADVLPGIVKAYREIDYVFIDGHHDGQATINYFKMLEPALAEGALVIFDDIFYSAGMMKAWNEIKKYPCWALTVATSQLGICVYRKNKTGDQMSVRL